MILFCLGSGQIKDTGRDTLTFRHMNKRSEITMMKDGLVLRSGTRTRAINKRSELRFNHGYQYLEEHVSKADNITEDGVAILPSRSPDVIAMAGSDIRLSCFVHNIQNKTVSFVFCMHTYFSRKVYHQALKFCNRLFKSR